MSEFMFNSKEEKQQVLKKIIRKLHEGVPIKKLKKRFCNNCSKPRS